MWPLFVATALLGCQPETLADRCRSHYPNPTNEQRGRGAASVPGLGTLPLYSPPDSMPQIYNADSSTGWFRSLFYARFDAFPGGQREVEKFILRFHARVVGRGDTAGWYAVTIPDPGADTTQFNLLLQCIGATYGVYVRSAYSRRPPSPLERVLPNQRLKLPARVH